MHNCCSRAAASISDERFEHTPVLGHEFIDALCVDPDGQYIDATFGRGGHARLLLARLSKDGRLLAFDRDPEAVVVGEALAREDNRFRMVHAPFSEISDRIGQLQMNAMAGIGFDLGVSSPQIDDASRGFSFQHEGPLDMRMDPGDGRPLLDRLGQLSARDLADILFEYGDERHSRRIAAAILSALAAGQLVHTRDLENICFHATPKRDRFGHTHPATRTFQALRIWVNDEVGQLNMGMTSAIACLRPGGRLAVISFHSGEDRKTRDLIESEVNACICPPDFPICACGKASRMRWVQKKPIRASEQEATTNVRSRSARLRVAERVA
ncbi:MAG: 16S rRNA (cytosine(1402)-N(4))-methyltransferase RsmH [Mariprofundaceae bacterium]